MKNGAGCEKNSAQCAVRSAKYQVPRTPHPAPRTYPGFTLLELLISMTILALIFVAVLGAIRVGSKSWEGGEQRAEENQRTRALFDTLARQLVMLYPLRVQEQDRDVIVFRGRPDSVSFAVLPESYGAEPFSHMARVVTYMVEPARGLVAAESYPLMRSASASGSFEGRAKQLDERVSEVRFRYLVPEGRPEEARPPAWRDAWDPSQDKDQPVQLRLPRRSISPRGQRQLQGSDRLPLAIEVTMTVRQPARLGVREFVVPPLVFPVQVGRTL